MWTNKNLLNYAVLLIAGIAFLSLACFAAEKGPEADRPKPLKVLGTVNVTKDANDVITKVTLTTKKQVIYNVVLNIKGLDLAKEMDGKEVEVEVHGPVKQVEDQKWIRVLNYKPVKKTPKTK